MERYCSGARCRRMQVRVTITLHSLQPHSMRRTTHGNYTGFVRVSRAGDAR